MRLFNLILFAVVFVALGVALFFFAGRNAPEPEFAAKPQTPAPPFEYLVEEIFVDAPDGAARLAGELTIPKGAGPHAAVLLLSVAGPTDRDQSYAGHKGFLVLADRLTRAGFAVARFDDRGAGASTGDYFSASWETLADDARAVVSRLAEDPRIDPHRIGFAGMSQGGAVAGLASDVGAFVILMSAPGLSGEEALRLQLEEALRSSGVGEKQAAQYRALFAEFMEIAKSDPNAKETRARLDAFLKGPGRELIPPYKFLPRDREGLIDVLLGEWYRSNVLFDPVAAYGGVTAPVLIIGGGKDVVAPARLHVPAIKEIFEGAAAEDVTVEIFPDLNHLLQEADTGLPTEYASLDSSFSPAAMDKIVSWLSERFPNGRP